MKLLGQGTYTKVYKTNDKKALKIIDYAEADGVEGCFMRELEILSFTRHPNLPKIFDIVVGSENISIYMELLEYPLEKVYKNLSQPIRKKFGWQLLNVVYYLHQNDIIHRDLALKNLMVKNDHLYLIDFNLSKRDIGMKGSPRIVSLDYRAPEVLFCKNSAYDGKAVDMWSVGCLLFEIYTGRKLFRLDSDSKKQLDIKQKNVIKNLYQMEKKYPLVCQLLKINPKDRFTAQQALEYKKFPIIEYPKYVKWYVSIENPEFDYWINKPQVKMVANDIYARCHKDFPKKILLDVACIDLACKACLTKYHDFSYYEKKFCINVDELFITECMILKYLDFQILF